MTDGTLTINLTQFQDYRQSKEDGIMANIQNEPQFHRYRIQLTQLTVTCLLKVHHYHLQFLYSNGGLYFYIRKYRQYRQLLSISPENCFIPKMREGYNSSLLTQFPKYRQSYRQYTVSKEGDS